MLFKSGVQLFNFHIKKTYGSMDQQTCTPYIQEIHWTMISILKIRRIDVLVCTDTRRHTNLLVCAGLHNYDAHSATGCVSISFYTASD